MPATKTNLRNVSQAVLARDEFQGSNLRGTHDRHLDCGRLPEQYRDHFNKAAADGAYFYVVVSYDTPIAYFADGQWFVRAVKYSSSTSRQLSSLRIPNPVHL